MDWRTVHGRDGERPAQSESPVRQVHIVTPKVGQSSPAKGPPVSPFERQIFRAVRPVLDRPQPQIVMHVRRHGESLLRQVQAAISRRHPDVHLAHRADRPALHQLDDATIIGAGVNLRADLGDPLHFPGGFGNDSRLGDRPGQRFLAVNVPAALQRRHGRDCVRVIGRADHHRVNVPLVKQAAKVIIRFGLGIFLLRRGKVIVVDVAKRDNVFPTDRLEIIPRAIGDSDHADIQFVIGRKFARLGPHAGEPGAGGR